MQKFGIHIAFQGSESFAHLDGQKGNAAALADGTSSLPHLFLQRQTERRAFSYALIYFMHVLAQIFIFF